MLILASASPRRQELLRNAGISFTVQAADVNETPHKGEEPCTLAKRLAREKALAIYHDRPNDFVLGADTIVIVNGQALGKPKDAEDAACMLRLLSGRSHHVTTGICLIDPVQSGAGNRKPETGSEDVRYASTRVTMGALTEEEIQSYVATGEPMDKAGAYAIQGVASRWIVCIEGDYFNVVGLPVSLVYRMLQEHGAIHHESIDKDLLRVERTG